MQQVYSAAPAISAALLFCYPDFRTEIATSVIKPAARTGIPGQAAGFLLSLYVKGQ
jgi:hypothetical protein